MRDQILGQRPQSFELGIRPAELDGYVAALDVASVSEGLTEPVHTGRFGRTRVEKSDHRHRRLLRSRAKWRRCGSTSAEKCDELASPHGGLHQGQDHTEHYSRSVVSAACIATKSDTSCPLMGWSGRAPAPPTSEAGKGAPKT